MRTVLDAEGGGGGRSWTGHRGGGGGGWWSKMGRRGKGPEVVLSSLVGS